MSDDQWNWLEDIQQIKYKNASIHINNNQVQHQIYFQDNSEFKSQFKELPLQCSIQQNFTKQIYKRRRQVVNKKNDFQSKKVQQNTGLSEQEMLQKGNKSLRQGQYSKAYRQKKKEKYKILQQENIFLKKKIDQLQLRLRQKQFELNRIKYQNHKQIPIQQLNQQFMQKVKLILDSTQIQKQKNNSLLQTFQIEQQKSYHTNSNSQNQKSQKQQKVNFKTFQKFIQVYEKHGFGGKGKKDILNYYINELLENCLKDSQKYYYICMIKNQGWAHMNKQQVKSKFNAIDYAVGDIMGYSIQGNQQQQRKMLYIEGVFKPYMINLNLACTQIFKSFQKLIDCLSKTQQFVKKVYSTNLELVVKRLKIQEWFQHNKYLKQMRNLRDEWINMIKIGEKQSQFEQITKSNDKKRKKEDILSQTN